LRFVFSIVGFSLSFLLTAGLESIGIRTGKLVSTLILAFGLFGFPPLAIRIWSITPGVKSRLVCDSLMSSTSRFLSEAGIPATEKTTAYIWLVLFCDVKWHLDQYSKALANRTFLCFVDRMARSRLTPVDRRLYEEGMRRRYDFVIEAMRDRIDHTRFPNLVAIAVGADDRTELLHRLYYTVSFDCAQLVLRDLN
jgi:hypothetical protein